MIAVTYVTSSEYKIAENAILVAEGSLASGQPVKERFEFDIRQVAIKEVLEVDIATMVAAEVTQAYAQLRVPCIVEHAGLIFDDYSFQGYPGGLTKPMWNALGEHFLRETQCAGRAACARAVVAYCDGQRIQTFVGETPGQLAEEPRGQREFYWDTVFIPNDSTHNPERLTYAEIVADGSLGLRHKVLNLSQSTKAIQGFLDHRTHERPLLWRDVA